ncbi:hypothetical protein Tco_0074180 [Tanacetum coccineum]
MHNWDIALEELNRLKEIIDSKILMRLFLSELYLFIESSSKQDMADALDLIHLLYHDNGRTQIIDLFNQDK